jgi:hypothetical protein
MKKTVAVTQISVESFKVLKSLGYTIIFVLQIRPRIRALVR